MRRDRGVVPVQDGKPERVVLVGFAVELPAADHLRPRVVADPVFEGHHLDEAGVALVGGAADPLYGRLVQSRCHFLLH